MREETPVGMSGPIAPGGGAGRPLRLEGLPVEGCPVQEPLLLPARRQRTPVGAAMRGILPADVAQTVAARHGASAEDGDESRTGGGTGDKKSVEVKE